jgi:hypothetical protein
VLGEIREDEIGRDRGDEVEAVLAKFALHVVFRGVMLRSLAMASMSWQYLP